MRTLPAFQPRARMEVDLRALTVRVQVWKKFRRNLVYQLERLVCIDCFLFRPKVLLAAKTYRSIFYDKSPPLNGSGEMVGPVRNYVTIKQLQRSLLLLHVR